ncbi:hypothetical protein HID58_001633 [Brassica napus]|uniref:Uncharacterized protein n=1 Tax=Brassica napus TaxID=3708 RepID=A0ABQ8EK96_BRANA|nr:hypothetical protein HID58_001633 [Brassica napus]
MLVHTFDNHSSCWSKSLSSLFFFFLFLALWNRLHFTLVITATVCCWLMWAIVYIAQMKPLIVPILSEVE